MNTHTHTHKPHVRSHISFPESAFVESQSTWWVCLSMHHCSCDFNCRVKAVTSVAAEAKQHYFAVHWCVLIDYGVVFFVWDIQSNHNIIQHNVCRGSSHIYGLLNDRVSLFLTVRPPHWVNTLIAEVRSQPSSCQTAPYDRTTEPGWHSYCVAVSASGETQNITWKNTVLDRCNMCMIRLIRTGVSLHRLR